MTRDAQIYVSRSVQKCLWRLASIKGTTADEEAQRILEPALKAECAELWAYYERVTTEEKDIIERMKKDYGQGT